MLKAALIYQFTMAGYQMVARFSNSADMGQLNLFTPTNRLHDHAGCASHRCPSIRRARLSVVDFLNVKDMIFGDPSRFAIESVLSEAVESTSMMAIGLFVVHVGGLRYGIYEPDATTLGNASFGVESRISRRGSHIAPFASESDATTIANSFRDAVYNPEIDDGVFFGFSQDEFRRLRHANRFEWNDVDEEFDDSSYLLQFDVRNQVRLIAYKSWDQDYHHAPATLRDVWIEADEFYNILQQWYDAFISEWKIARTKLELQGNTVEA